jgi:ABC-type uncharacterized transport system ATPase subunit
MSTVEVNHVVKSYADKVAVDDLSFAVEPTLRELSRNLRSG